MGKGVGLWIPCYRQMFDHEKTQDAVGHLLVKWPKADPWVESLAVQVVTSSVLRLNLTLLDRLSDTGRFRRPTGVKFLSIVWPEYDADAIGIPQSDVGDLLIEVLTESGYVEEIDHMALKVHDYETHNARIIRDRKRKRKDRGASADSPTPTPTPTPTPKKTSSSTPPTPPEPGAGDIPDCPMAEIAKAWRDVAEARGTRWIRHRKIPGGEPAKFVRARWRECHDLARWRIAMEAAADDEWWRGAKTSSECPQGWRATIGSFTRDKHFDRFLSIAEESDWRLAGDRELSWRLYREKLEHTEEAPAGYDGPHPEAMDLTPAEGKAEWEKLRAWWDREVYAKEARR